MTNKPRFFLMSKLARLEVVRNCIVYFSRGQRKSYDVSKENPSIFRDVNVDGIVSSLKTDGYYLGLNLPHDVLEEILEFANSTACYGDRNPEFEFRYSEKEELEASLGKKIRLGSYLKNIYSCPVFKKLENDPGILAIAANFLGGDPVHVGSELWWSFPVPSTQSQRLQSAQVFHYDIDDYRCIKIFFYLTDVDLSNGPHICIRGSHKNKKLAHQLLGQRCANKDGKGIVDYYGNENVMTLCGPAGFGFVEDSYCFHKGTPPSEKDRLLLQIEFALNNYGDIRH